MTEAELTIEEIKAKMQETQELVDTIGDALDGRSVGVGAIALVTSIAIVAVNGDIPLEEIISLVTSHYEDIVSAEKEEGLSSLH